MHDIYGTAGRNRYSSLAELNYKVTNGPSIVLPIRGPLNIIQVCDIGVVRFNIYYCLVAIHGPNCFFALILSTFLSLTCNIDYIKCTSQNLRLDTVVNSSIITLVELPDCRGSVLSILQLIKPIKPTVSLGSSYPISYGLPPLFQKRIQQHHQWDKPSIGCSAYSFCLSVLLISMRSTMGTFEFFG